MKDDEKLFLEEQEAEETEETAEETDGYDEDEAEYYEPERRTGAVNTKRLIGAAVIIALVVVIIISCVVSIAGKGGKNATSTQKPPEADISEADVTVLDLGFDPSASYDHAVTDSKIFFFNVDNVKVASMSGEIENDVSIKVSRPMISTAGNYALISDRNGRTAHVFSGSKLERSYALDANIQIAKINKNGYALFVTDDDVHKCAVSVKDSSGEEAFRWKSGSYSVVAAALDDNNKDLALTTLITDGGVMTSNVYMFNITKDKPFTNDVYENDIYSAVEFRGNYLYCIGTAQTLIYNGYGKCINTIDYAERELMTYDIDENVVLVYADSSVYTGGSMVCSYNAKGTEQGAFAVDGDVPFIDVRSGSIAVSNNRVVSILNSSCKEKFQLKTATALSDFKYVGGTSTAVGISATGAEIINVRK